MILVRVFRNAKYTFWSKFYHFIHVIGNGFMKCMLGIPSKSTSMDDDDYYYYWTSSWKLEFLGCLGHPYTSSLANHYCDGGRSLNSEGLDWTSPWTWYQCIQGKFC